MTLQDLNEKLFLIAEKHESGSTIMSLYEDFEDLLLSVKQHKIAKAQREQARREFLKTLYEDPSGYKKYFNKKNPLTTDTSSVFYDKSILFTGELNGLSREHAMGIVYTRGGIIKSTLSPKIDIVIIGSIAPGPAKLKQIEELIEKGVNIYKMYEEEFINISESE